MKARCCIAAKATIEALRDAALKAIDAVEAAEDKMHDCADFDAVLDYCRPLTEEIGGEEGSDAWYFWTVGEFTVMGDLGLLLHQNTDAIAKMSEILGTGVYCCAIDADFEFAHFSAYLEGEQRRLLVLEDDEVVMEGLPVEAERGRPTVDFSVEEGERMWTFYGLPTFEFDPEGGPFKGQHLKRDYD
ncbi:MAG: hypothetical protein ACE366_11435 [Bradymonadia bacterium]